MPPVPLIAYLPGLLVGLIVGFYWARVLKLVLKARRTTGRSANFLPPEPLGRALRVIWYPTVAAWIALPLATSISPTLARQLLYRTPWATWPAVAVALLALVLTMACWRRMGRSWRMGIDPAERTGLVVTGPFAFVRHPIYALSSLLMLASVAAVPHPAMLVVGAIHLLFLQWEARREERHMVRSHGEVYERYMANVGRFVPRSVLAYRPPDLVGSGGGSD